jgi:tetratricopeptide (TPR) repeat protein
LKQKIQHNWLFFIKSLHRTQVINLILQNNITIKNQQTLEFKVKEKEFLSFINNGDEWFEKGKWHNSIFYYEKAKEIFPKNYEINYRLVRSYSFQCENEFKNCHEAKKLLEKLFLMFPNKENELLEIKDKIRI